MPLEIAASPDLADFVKFPFTLYSPDSRWVPPLQKQDQHLLDPGRHPFWQSAERQLFVVRRDNRIVGRIAAIVDHKYNNYAGETCGSFGFFECENDQEAAAQLLAAAGEWNKARGMTFLRGPFNPSANYSCGLLVSGFDQNPAVMMPWNPPYYAALLEHCGLRKEEDLFAYVIERDSLELAPWLKNEVARLKAEGRFQARKADKKRLAEDIHAMLELYRQSWAENWGFSPLSKGEADQHVHDLKSILDPDFFVLFFDGAKPVAGMVALPDMNPLLKRLNGRLGLTAPWHFWRSYKQIKQGLRIMLFGILPEYRLQGLPLLLLDYMLEQSRKKPGLSWVEGSWILERNLAMNDLMEDFSGRLAKRYRIYRRELAVC